jgi:outer membrane protein assembly factor BamB
MPILALVLAAGGIVVVQFSDLVPDEALRGVFSMMAGIVGVILITGWWLLFSGFSWRVRPILPLLLAAGLALLFTGLEADGFSGGMQARFVAKPWLAKLLPTNMVAWLGTKPAALPSLAKLAENPRPVVVGPADYPQFLGPNRLGVVEGRNLDPDWGAHPPKELWRKKVGLGWSSFAVAGPIAVTQEQRGEDEMVVAYDVKDGEVVWANAIQAKFSEQMGGDGPRATPTIHDGRVYAQGATGALECLDAASGKSLWDHPVNVLEKAHARNLQWGMSNSPLVIDDLGVVVVTLGQGGDGSLAAYDVKTGERQWVGGDGATDKASYSSPMLLTLGGKRQIVSINDSTVTGHDLADGAVLWRYPWDPGKAPAKASQPILLSEDRLLLLAGYGCYGVVLQVKHDGDKWDTEEVYRTNKMRTKFSTAQVRDHYAYGLDDGGLACIDLDDEGKQRWQVGARSFAADHYGYGQTLMVDDLLIVQSELSGEIVLVKAVPDGFHKLSVIHAFKDKTWNNPALAGNKLFIRNDREAVCYELPTRPAESSSGEK